MLDDVLKEGLKLVICGTAAGNVSAKKGQYYAGPGNKFWKILHKAGITKREYKPDEFGKLPEEKIGLTDLVKTESGMDKKLSKDSYDRKGLISKLREHQPKVVCFNGKEAARRFFIIEYGVYDFEGLYKELGYKPIFFIAPSTSGAAAKSWDESKWYELGKILEKTMGA